MQVSEVMTQAVVTEAAEDSISEAAAKMREQQTGSLLVMEGNALIGIFTERDLLKAVAQGRDPKLVQVKEVMTQTVITISPETKLREAATIMGSKWIRHLPVLEEGKVIGVVSQRDLLGALAQTLSEPETLHREGEELPRARRLKRIEAGDLD